jgi:hypothetical protein
MAITYRGGDGIATLKTDRAISTRALWAARLGAVTWFLLGQQYSLSVETAGFATMTLVLYAAALHLMSAQGDPAEIQAAKRRELAAE